MFRRAMVLGLVSLAPFGGIHHRHRGEHLRVEEVLIPKTAVGGPEWLSQSTVDGNLAVITVGPIPRRDAYGDGTPRAMDVRRVNLDIYGHILNTGGGGAGKWSVDNLTATVRTTTGRVVEIVPLAIRQQGFSGLTMFYEFVGNITLIHPYELRDFEQLEVEVMGTIHEVGGTPGTDSVVLTVDTSTFVGIFGASLSKVTLYGDPVSR